MAVKLLITNEVVDQCSSGGSEAPTFEQQSRAVGSDVVVPTNY